MCSEKKTALWSSRCSSVFTRPGQLGKIKWACVACKAKEKIESAAFLPRVCKSFLSFVFSAQSSAPKGFWFSCFFLCRLHLLVVVALLWGDCCLSSVEMASALYLPFSFFCWSGFRHLMSRIVFQLSPFQPLLFALAVVHVGVVARPVLLLRVRLSLPSFFPPTFSAPSFRFGSCARWRCSEARPSLSCATVYFAHFFFEFATLCPVFAFSAQLLAPKGFCFFFLLCLFIFLSLGVALLWSDSCGSCVEMLSQRLKLINFGFFRSMPHPLLWWIFNPLPLVVFFVASIFETVQDQGQEDWTRWLVRKRRHPLSSPVVKLVFCITLHRPIKLFSFKKKKMGTTFDHRRSSATSTTRSAWLLLCLLALLWLR